MWEQEAKWLGNFIYGLDADLVFPMLDIGSSSEYFRKIAHPFIDAHLFAPAREKGLSVLHSDLEDAPGVDLVGDL